MSYESAPPPPPPGGGQPPYGGGQPPYGGGQPPYGGGQPPYGAVPQGNSSKAIWSLVLGILSVLCCTVFTGIPAILLSRSAQNDIAATGGMQGGTGMAKAGFILGIIGCVFFVLSIVLYAAGVTRPN